jgi:hypothetical protein
MSQTILTIFANVCTYLWNPYNKQPVHNGGIQVASSKNKHSINSEDCFDDILAKTLNKDAFIHRGENTPYDFNIIDDCYIEVKESFASYICNDTPVVSNYNKLPISYFLVHKKKVPKEIRTQSLICGSYLTYGQDTTIEKIKKQLSVYKHRFANEIKKIFFQYDKDNILSVHTRIRFGINTVNLYKKIKQNFQIDFIPNFFCITSQDTNNINNLIQLSKYTINDKIYYLYVPQNYQKILTNSKLTSNETNKKYGFPENPTEN